MSFREVVRLASPELLFIEHERPDVWAEMQSVYESEYCNKEEKNITRMDDNNVLRFERKKKNAV